MIPRHPEEVSYVRVVAAQDTEIACWTTDEISEDSADELGAIFGAVLGAMTPTDTRSDR